MSWISGLQVAYETCISEGVYFNGNTIDPERIILNYQLRNSINQRILTVYHSSGSWLNLSTLPGLFRTT